MKNITGTSPKNPPINHSHSGVSIPDPAEWVYEHHFLASCLHTLAHLKQMLPDGIQESEVEGEFTVDTTVKDLLKASFSDDRWQYLENYLAWET